MNRLVKTLAVAAALGASLVSNATIAAQKIGVVNVQAVFQQVPQAAMIQDEINKEFKDDIAEVKRLEKDITYYIEKLQRDAATMSADEKTKLEEQITKLREDYEGKAKPLNMNVRRRQNEEQNKILALIQQTIQQIATDDKFDIILQQQSVAFIAPDSDITAKVVDKVSKIK